MKDKKIMLPERFLIQSMILLFAIDRLVSDNQPDFDYVDFLDTDGKEAYDYLQATIDEKIKSMNIRKAYVNYRNAEGPERNEFRKKYLDLAGIHKDWRSDEEI